jgi:hypothetical protein
VTSRLVFPSVRLRPLSIGVRTYKALAKASAKAPAKALPKTPAKILAKIPAKIPARTACGRRYMGVFHSMFTGHPAY